MAVAQSVLGVGAILGEGPVWLGDALWFVDIKAMRVYRFDPASGEAQHWDAPAQVGWVLPTVDGGMLAGLQTGVHRFSSDDGTFVLLHDPEPDHSDNRLNDATTDSKGRLWFGSMDNGESKLTGRLYRFMGGECVDSCLPAVAITNGPSISADARTLYHTDTLGKIIWRVPLHDDGTIGAPEQHIVIEDGAGYPDGSVIDAEGCLWTGLYGGWSVRRYDPEGTLMQSVRFPVSNITKMAFGGEGLRTAYATTASKGLSDAERAEQPEAGNLFTFDPGVAGLPVTPAQV